MSANSIGIDPRTMKHLLDQMEILKKDTVRSMYSALTKTAFKIKSEAQLRLTGRGHIITSRLKNSLFVKTQTPVDSLSYSDGKGHSYSSDLSTVKLGKDEIAVGTNVEYAASIEFGSKPHVIEAKNKNVLSNGSKFFGKRVNHPGWKGDSFLYWAMKNVDVTKSVGEDMRNSLKFGAGKI
jgi:phage gpG-like protein